MGASGNCSQVISSRSIVVKDKTKIWKYIVADKEAMAVLSSSA